MSLYKDLSEEEIKEFREWARINYFPGDIINKSWHPIVREECRKINDNKVKQKFSNLIKNHHTNSSGPGEYTEEFELHNGQYLVISHEYIGLYDNTDEWADGKEPTNSIRLDLRKFMVWFNEEVYSEQKENQNPRIIEGNFFCSSNGFSEENLDAINSLDIGWSYSMDLNSQIITRIK